VYKTKIILSIFSFCFFVEVFGRDYSLSEKMNGESSAIYPKIDSSYLYNPSILALNRKNILIPLKIEVYSDEVTSSLIKNYNVFKKLKGGEIVEKVRSLSGQDLTFDMTASTIFMHNNFSFALQGKSYFDILIRDKRAIPTLEYFTFLDFKTFFSYAKKVNRNLFLGVSLKPIFGIYSYFNEDALLIQKKTSILNPIKNKINRFKLNLDLGSFWKKKLLKNRFVFLGLTLLNIHLYDENLNIDSFDVVDPMLFRFGGGAVLLLEKFSSKLKVSYNYSHELETKTVETEGHSLGFSLDIFNALVVSSGYQDDYFAYGLSYYNKYFQIILTRFKTKSSYLMSSYYTLKNACSIKLNVPL